MSDLFVDAAMKPYNFYLCPPLNNSYKLIKLIEANGGKVVNDFLQNCIVISSKDIEIPEDLKSAHIYSYEVIQDSANRGSQQEFSNYLIHVPNVIESIPHQFSEKKNLNIEDDEINVHDFDFSNLSKPLNEQVFRNDYHDQLHDNSVNNSNNKNNNNQYNDDENGNEDGGDHDHDHDHDEDDDNININNHNNNAYQNNNGDNRINSNSNNRNDNGTNTDAYGIRYIMPNHEEHNEQSHETHNPHQADHETRNLVLYETANVRYFSPEEDRFLFEEVRKFHWMGIKGHSLYAKIASNPFFVSRNRSTSSLRERMRTLKYNLGYVYKTGKNNKLLKDANGNYIPTTDITSKLTPYTAYDDIILCKTIYENIDIVTNERGYENIVFPTSFYDKFAKLYDNHTPESWRQRFKNYILVFGIANYLKYYIIQIKNNKTPLPTNTANKEWLLARNHMKKTDGPKLYFPGVPEGNDIINNNLYLISIPGYEDKEFEFENPFREAKRRKLLNEQNSALQPDNNDHIMQEMIQNIKKSEDEHQNMLMTQADDENESDEETVFIDEPTTYFQETVFMKAYKRNPDCIDKSLMDNKEELIDKVKEIFSSQGSSPKEISQKLISIGVRQYYTVFLIFRCQLDQSNMLKCIINYIKTEGQELLVVKPGIWSNKSMDYIAKKDEHYDDLLRDYHGKRQFKKFKQIMEKTQCRL